MEMLLEHSFSPSRTVMFAFGFDEEIGGYNVVIFLDYDHMLGSCTDQGFCDVGCSTYRAVSSGHLWSK